MSSHVPLLVSSYPEAHIQGHIVETGKQQDFDHSEDDFEDAEDPFALQFADLVQNQKQDLED